MTTWGLVATVKAPAEDILRFAAYHLEAGAHRIYIYLDAPNPTAQTALRDHPKCRVKLCDASHWQSHKTGRPDKHQLRQSINATRAYRRATEVDWLIHMDVDEFLVPEHSVADSLGALPQRMRTARVRPMEALARSAGETGPQAFKAFIPNGPERTAIVQEIYPTFGPFVKGGFVSHVAGKIFARTGMKGVRMRIHNAMEDQQPIKEEAALPEIALAHCHAASWPAWRRAYAYRRDKGSYRAELLSATPEPQGGMNLHRLFGLLESEEGDTGLRTFFDEVCADTPLLRQRLADHGLLRLHDLALADKRKRHFGDVPVQ
jgi:hypothetical protein